LINGHLLNCNETNNEGSLIPVTPADKLRPSEVVQLILGNELLPGKGGQLASRAVDAATGAVDSDPFFTQPPSA
jgi:hypothetical protein